MIKIAIVDDDPLFVERIYNMIMHLEEDKAIRKYTDPTIFISDICNDSPNLIFLDIEMPQLSGIEISKFISNSFEDVFIIFLTNRDELVFKAFNKNVIGFIPKSRIEEEWKNMEIKIKNLFENCCSILKTSDGVISMAKKDILFFERISRKLYLYTIDGLKYQLYYSSIQELIQLLNYNQIYLINKSEGINLKYITSYKNPIIRLKNCTNDFYLSKYRKDDFLLKYFNSRKQSL